MLDRGEVIVLLADQYAGPKGCWVEFFGRPASTHKAIALLALDRQAPVATVYAKRVGGPLQLELGTAAVTDPRHQGVEVAGIRELTEWYTGELEEMIRHSPEQYWWVHRRWKDTRKRRPSRARRAA